MIKYSILAALILLDKKIVAKSVLVSVVEETI